MQQHFPSFRDGGDAINKGSALVWAPALQTWLCGDVEGKIFKKTAGGDFEEIALLDGVAISALAVHPTQEEIMVAADDSICKRSLTNLDHSLMEQVSRTEVSFAHMQYDHEGDFLFTAAKDGDVIVLNVQNGQAEQCERIKTDGHPVASLALSADSRHIALVDAEGALFVYRLEFQARPDGRRLVQVDLLTMKNGIVAKQVARGKEGCGCSVAFHPTKLLLAVPTDAGVVVLRPSATGKEWEELFMVDAHSAALNLCAFSPSGEYLASADLTGAVVVWAFDAGQPDASASLRTLDPIEVLQDLAWGRGPEDNYVVTLSLSDWAQAEAVPASHLSGGGGMPAQAQAQAGERGHSQGTGTGTQGGTQGTQGYTQTQGTQEEDIEAMDFLGESAPMPASSTANVTTSATTSTASATAPEEVVLGDAELAMIEAAEAAYTQQESAPAPAPTAPRPSVTFLPTPATATTTTAPTVTATAAPTTAPTTAATVPTAPIAPAPHKRLSKNGEGTAGDDEDDFLDEDSSPTTPEAVGGKTKVRDRDEDEDEDSINDEEADQVMDVDMAGVEAGMGGGMGVSGVEMRELLRLAQAVPKVQAAVLHPSSTRFDERNRRYLVWNNVGSIVLREEKVEGRVEIKFANTAGGNRNESFADHTGYVMAALSYEGALFASEADEDEGRDRDDFKKETAGSTLYYHAFPAQQQLGGANESFRWTLHNGESAVAVAAGRGWVAVATSRNLLYIYSAAGMPCGVFSLPGPAVSLSGSGARLAVVYRTHALHMDLYEINWQAGCRCAKLATCAMPMPDTRKDLEGPTSMLLTAGVQVVPKEQALAWLGFDVDNGLPVALDVQGMLWSLLRADGATWQWVPVLDVRTARKSSEHTYWPVTVRFGKLVYVLLNGESRPEIFPQPIVTTRSLRVPVPGVRDGKDVGEVQKERMHAIIWGSALTAHTEAQLGEALECKEPMEDPAVLEARVAQLQLEADKAVVKALQDACVRQRIPLALSLALQLRTEQAIQGAIQVANHFGRPTVAEALDRILEHRQALAALLEQQEEQQQYSNNNYQQEQEQQQEVEVEYVPAPRGGRREQQQQEEEQEEFGNMENEERPLGFLSSRLVSPQLPPPHPTPTHSSTSKPRNPFAVVSSGQTPVKRKSVFDGIQDLKASPSPKKPALGRQSTFSQQARQQRLSDKHIL